MQVLKGYISILFDLFFNFKKYYIKLIDRGLEFNIVFNIVLFLIFTYMLSFLLGIIMLLFNTVLSFYLSNDSKELDSLLYRFFAIFVGMVFLLPLMMYQDVGSTREYKKIGSTTYSILDLRKGSTLHVIQYINNKKENISVGFCSPEKKVPLYKETRYVLNIKFSKYIMKCREELKRANITSKKGFNNEYN